MFKKGAKLYSILNNKCPRCHNGDFFVSGNLLKFKKLIKLHERCEHCDLKYMMEPSFFYGAMFVNYGLTVGVGIITFSITKLLLDLSLLQSFLSIVIALIILTPLTMRLSRLIWINLFVSFEKGMKKVD